LWRDLEESGDILPGRQNILGTTGILLTPHACHRLNLLKRKQLFLEDVILKLTPEEEALLMQRKHMLN
jgi:hypothetical protein